MKLTDTAVCWQKGQKRQTGGDNMIVTSTFGQTIREGPAILRFTSLPFLTFEHGGKWYELKPTGISKRICGARKKTVHAAEVNRYTVAASASFTVA